MAFKVGAYKWKRLERATKTGSFGKDEISVLGLCEDYILGKSYRLKLKSAIHTTKEKIWYIHSDLWGLHKCH